MVSKVVLWLSILLSLQSSVPTSADIAADNLFRNGNSQNGDNSKCEEIEGTLKDSCWECYNCNHTKLKDVDPKGMEKLILNQNDCTSQSELCCISQVRYGSRNKDDECGKRNPDGYPRRLRSSPRSVLQGEFSWRVWIYRVEEPQKPLCAGTYLGLCIKAVLTSASCVYKYTHSDLRVRFDKNLTRSDDPIPVLNMTIHPDFVTDTNLNDIALLSLASAPSWSQKACLPEYPALQGTPCIAIPAEDIYLDQVLLRPDSCVDKGKPMDKSFMCTAGRKEAYKPEPGSGLICEDESSKTETFVVYGISLLQLEENKVSVGTNVTNYFNWIVDTIEKSCKH